MDDTLRALVVAGWTSFEQLVVVAEELLEDAGLDPADGRSRARSVWDARVAELAGAAGRGPSDHERLAEAFAVLGREHGFVTAMSAGFDKGELWYELRERRRAAGGTAWAGAGFHEQDAEVLARTPAVLHLLYSVFAPRPGHPAGAVEEAMRTEAGGRALAEADAAVAAELLLDALRAAGLEAEWDGSTASRVRVRITDWRKSLPAD